jgi:hypothetical protein
MKAYVVCEGDLDSTLLQRCDRMELKPIEHQDLKACTSRIENHGLTESSPLKGLKSSHNGLFSLFQQTLLG